MISGSLWKKRRRYLYNIKTILQLSCSKNVKYLFYNICYFLSQQSSCMFIGVRDFNPFPLPLPPRLPGTSWPRIVDYLGDPQTLAISPPPPLLHSPPRQNNGKHTQMRSLIRNCCVTLYLHVWRAHITKNTHYWI